MKYFIKIFILPILIIACSENPIDPKDEKKFWSVPSDEAIMLYFRQFDSVRLDSFVAGEIQYRLDIAKSVVDDTTVKVRKDWEFGKLLLKTNDELYSAFDTTTTFRFNFQPLDSLLSLYELKSGYKLSGLIRLKFPEYYNMVTLSQIFNNVEGVNWAEQNAMARRPICNEDIGLEIEKKVYKFIFNGNCPRHFWVVQVVDDSITDITDWDGI